MKLHLKLNVFLTLFYFTSNVLCFNQQKAVKWLRLIHL